MNWDISAFKHVPLGGNRRLQLRVELYARRHRPVDRVNTNASFDYTTGALTNANTFGRLTGPRTVRAAFSSGRGSLSNASRQQRRGRSQERPFFMRQIFLVLTMFVGAAQSRPPDIPFRIHPIDLGASETAAVADVNKDGRLDIVSGEHWYQAPVSLSNRAVSPSNGGTWTKHRFRELGFSNQYIDNFSDLAVDVDGDGYPDIVSVSWFAKKVAWWRNPGPSTGSERDPSTSSGQGVWKEAPINSGFNVEFALLADLDNDGKANEVLAQENGTGQSWYEIRDKTWIKHVISDRSYGHGIGAGDVNADKRNDILTPRGWLEAPEDQAQRPLEVSRRVGVY